MAEEFIKKRNQNGKFINFGNVLGNILISIRSKEKGSKDGKIMGIGTNYPSHSSLMKKCFTSFFYFTFFSIFISLYSAMLFICQVGSNFGEQMEF